MWLSWSCKIKILVFSRGSRGLTNDFFSAPHESVGISPEHCIPTYPSWRCFSFGRVLFSFHVQYPSTMQLVSYENKASQKDACDVTSHHVTQSYIPIGWLPDTWRGKDGPQLKLFVLLPSCHFARPITSPWLGHVSRSPNQEVPFQRVLLSSTHKELLSHVKPSISLSGRCRLTASMVSGIARPCLFVAHARILLSVLFCTVFI